MQYSNIQQVIDTCKKEPHQIFSLMKQGEFEVVAKLVEKNIINVNLCDNLGNDMITKLLKAKEYELVLKLMKKRNWDVNHQNEEGDTFGHILASDSSISAIKVIKELTKKKNYLPNIKNKKGQTVLDIAIHRNHIYTAFKILEDKRFNDINISSFRKLCHACMDHSYGKYSKLNNLEIMIENLEKKELAPNMSIVIQKIQENMELIRKEIMKNHSSFLDHIINHSLETGLA